MSCCLNAALLGCRYLTWPGVDLQRILVVCNIPLPMVDETCDLEKRYPVLFDDLTNVDALYSMCDIGRNCIDHRPYDTVFGILYQTHSHTCMKFTTFR